MWCNRLGGGAPVLWLWEVGLRHVTCLLSFYKWFLFSHANFSTLGGLLSAVRLRCSLFRLNVENAYRAPFPPLIYIHGCYGFVSAEAKLNGGLLCQCSLLIHS